MGCLWMYGCGQMELNVEDYVEKMEVSTRQVGVYRRVLGVDWRPFASALLRMRNASAIRGPLHELMEVLLINESPGSFTNSYPCGYQCVIKVSANIYLVSLGV